MKQTSMVMKAREIAERVFGDITDKTGNKYLQTLDAIAGQMNDEYSASIVYLQRILDNSDLTPLALMKEGMAMRVAVAAQRIRQIENELYDDYLKRIATDDLLYSVVLATADYLRDTQIYNTSDLVTIIAETAHYSMTYRFLRLYHDGKYDIW